MSAMRRASVSGGWTVPGRRAGRDGLKRALRARGRRTRPAAEGCIARTTAVFGGRGRQATDRITPSARSAPLEPNHAAVQRKGGVHMRPEGCSRSPRARPLRCSPSQFGPKAGLTLLPGGGIAASHFSRIGL